MGPLVVVALLLSWSCCSSAQLLFNKTESVEYTNCNTTVVIPCVVTNMGALSLQEIFVRWKFGAKSVYYFNGEKEESGASAEFPSAEIVPEELLRGIASLKMKASDAVQGNYTCEVTDLSREGETTIELKYRVVPCVVLWFSPKEITLIITFPMFAMLLFWGQFGAVIFKYGSSFTKGKIILLCVPGLAVTTIVIVGAFLFVPGEYSTMRATGLGLIVVPAVILVFLQCLVLVEVPTVGVSFFSVAILTAQGLGFVLAAVGLSLCVSVHTAMHGPLVISGLAIMALAELLALIYMKVLLLPRNN